MKLPEDAKSLDDVFRFLMHRLDAESCCRLQAMLREYESDAAELWIGLGRQEMLVLIQVPTKN
jgi:hypothetical protein